MAIHIVVQCSNLPSRRRTKGKFIHGTRPVQQKWREVLTTADAISVHELAMGE
jgi:hypothetical protein